MKNNSKIKTEKTINSLSEFTNFLLKKRKETGLEFVYRGEEDYPNNVGNLTPYIFRNDKKRIVEKDLINGVINERPNDFENSNSTLDVLIKMQHYGIPTRLLDISFNPYKALYFSLENPFDRNKRADGYFYLIDKRNFSEKTINSDAVSIVSSVSRLSNEDKRELSETYKFFLLCKALIYKLLILNIEQSTDIKPSHINSDNTLIEFERLSKKLIMDYELKNIESFLQTKIKTLGNPEELFSFYQTNASINEFGIPFCSHEDIEKLLTYIEKEYKILLGNIEKDLPIYIQDSLKGTEINNFYYLKKSFNHFFIVEKLLHEVRNFNPGFTNGIVMEDLVKNFLILPRNTNQRIINQEGGFILSGLQLSNKNILIKDDKVIIIKIPYKSKKAILDELESLHSISESYIYPELDHYNFRKYEKNQYTVDDHRIKIDGSTVTIYSETEGKYLQNRQNFLLATLKKWNDGTSEVPTSTTTNAELAKKIFNILHDRNENIK
ncbi:FRG domain-containing protein [Enterococcus sp. LJL120]